VNESAAVTWHYSYCGWMATPTVHGISTTTLCSTSGTLCS